MLFRSMAINGMDGLSLVSQVQPDVLFLDVQLPDLSGLDFLEKMSSHTHGKCRVVMYTAYDEYILPAFRKKAFDVLLKPIDEEDLATIMHRLTHEDVFVLHPDESNCRKQNSKFLFYTNTLDFKLIDKRDIGLFQYNHEQRCWEVVVAGNKRGIRLNAKYQERSPARFERSVCADQSEVHHQYGLSDRGGRQCVPFLSSV